MFNIIKVSGDKQGEELFELEFSDGTKELVNTWDYAALYKHPRLYERIYGDVLKCRVYDAIWKSLSEATSLIDKFRVLDVACGSGLMGQYLKMRTPIETELLVGVDVLSEAIAALHRDTPDIYDKTYVATEDNTKELKGHEFNCMIVCAAANYMNLDDYKNYVGLLSPPAFIAFDLKDDPHDERRVKILEWMDRNFHLCRNELYDHRELMNGSVIQHEVFLYRKDISSFC